MPNRTSRNRDRGESKEVVSSFVAAQDSLVLQASDLSLETIAAMVDQGSIDVAPHYQRRERWKADRQSNLIESFLLNVPVPPVYLAEDDFGTYSVIDGKQRITSIRRFMRNELKLGDLRRFNSLEGYSFNELPRELRNALQVRPYLRVVTLLKQSDPELKYEVFTRLNTGGERLNAQEIRNVVYRGPLNTLIVKLGEETDFLKSSLKIKGKTSAAYQRMDDAEMVLRFLTLKKDWEHFSGDYRDSMNRFMGENNNADDAFLRRSKVSFNNAIKYCERVWGAKAFKRPGASGWRDQMLAGMYDAQMICASLLSKSEREASVRQKSAIVRATKKLFMEDTHFEKTVRQATNTPSFVAYRIETLLQSIREVI